MTLRTPGVYGFFHYNKSQVRNQKIFEGYTTLISNFKTLFQALSTEHSYFRSITDALCLESHYLPLGITLLKDVEVCSNQLTFVFGTQVQLKSI